MNKRKFRLSRFILAVVVILLLAMVFGLICKFTQIDDKIVDLFDTTFRVEYNGVNYKGDNNKISLPKGEQARFNVKSVNGYKVVITPNVTADTDFVYTVDGVEHKYSETNFNTVFLSQDNMQSGYFTLNALDDYSIESVLSKVYEGQTVLVDNVRDMPYLLTISFGESKVQFVIYTPITLDVTLDCDHIVF